MSKKYNATDIGRMFDISARKINEILEKLGFQERDHGSWWITDKGKELSEVTSQNNGYGGSHKAVWASVKWDESIIETIKEYLDQEE